MDMKQYMAPEAEMLTVSFDRCILSELAPNQNRSSVEDATAVDGTW